MQVMPGGAPQGRPRQEQGAGIEGDIKRALSGVKSIAKPAGQLVDALRTPDFGTFDRGAAEPAFQAQRAGERQDFSPAALTSLDVPSMPGVFSNFPNAGVPATTPLAPDTTFSMMPSSTGNFADVAPGATSTVEGPATSGLSATTTGGMGAGLGSKIATGVAGGLTAAMALYNLAQAVRSGSPSGIAGSAYGTVAAVPAAIAAAQAAGVAIPQIVSTVASAAAIPLAIAAPIVIGAIGAWQADETRNAMRDAGRRLRGELGVNYNAIGENALKLGEIDPNRVDPAKQQDYLNALGRMFQTQDPTSGAGEVQTAGLHVNMSPMENAYEYARAGSNPSATGDNQAQMNEYGKQLLAGVPAQYERMVYELMKNPNLELPNWESGNAKVKDIQQLPGNPLSTWYEHLPNTPEPYVTQYENGQGFVVPNPALGGQFPAELLSSPYFAQQYWQQKGVTPQQAFLYGTGLQAQQYGGMPFGLPGTEGGFGAYDPAALYQYLVAQGLPELEAQQAVAQGSQTAAPEAGATAPAEAGATAPVGSTTVGATDVGTGASAMSGAGKLSPTFATPEIDRVQQITGAGKLQGRIGQEQQSQGQPFGMRGPQPQAVFGQRGGMAVGQSPFGMPPRGGQQNAGASYL